MDLSSSMVLSAVERVSGIRTVLRSSNSNPFVTLHIKYVQAAGADPIEQINVQKPSHIFCGLESSNQTQRNMNRDDTLH